MLVMAAGLIVLFVVAAKLDPYHADGSARRMAVHEQLGMKPCHFLRKFGRPCPTCGMTTSFALLMHGDVLSSLRANWVGTLLALYGLVLIPWSLASVVLRRPVFIVSLEKVVSASVVTFLGLMLLRWAAVIALAWWERQTF